MAQSGSNNNIINIKDKDSNIINKDFKKINNPSSNKSKMINTNINRRPLSSYPSIPANRRNNGGDNDDHNLNINTNIPTTTMITTTSIPAINTMNTTNNNNHHGFKQNLGLNLKYLHQQLTPISHANNVTPTMQTKYIPKYNSGTSSVYVDDNLGNHSPNHPHITPQITPFPDQQSEPKHGGGGIHSAVSSMTGFVDVGYKPYHQYDTDLNQTPTPTATNNNIPRNVYFNLAPDGQNIQNGIHSAASSMNGFVDIAYNNNNNNNHQNHNQQKKVDKPRISNELSSMSHSPLPDLPDTDNINNNTNYNHIHINVCIK